MKTCSKCGIEKELSEFHKNKLGRDGLRPDCKVCVNTRSTAWAAANNERHKENCRKYYQSNAEQCRAGSRKWAAENREHRREIKSAWRKQNPDKVAAQVRRYQANNREKVNAYLHKRLADNATLRIAKSIGESMRQALRQRKAGRKWSEIVGYDVVQLVARLESLFTDGMTWDNYGEWHIDHIRPVASFDFSKPGDIQKCWALANLQPLWALDNIRKGAKWASAN